METPSRQFTEAELGALASRHSHDVRNVLNGMELELTLLDETAPDASVRESVASLRQSLAQTATLVRRLLAKLVPEDRLPLAVADLAEQWRADAAHSHAGSAVEWRLDAGDALLEAEPAALRTILAEMLALGARLGRQQPVTAAARIEAGHAVFSVAPRAPAGEPLRAEESLRLVWSALGRIAAASHGTLTPRSLGEGPPFPMELRCALRQ